jgi:hypothetical protein
MALANFLGKSALSASQVLKDFDFEVFKRILLSHRVRICFNKKTAASNEGFASLDMLVRLLSRLYPNLHLECVDGKSPERDHLNELSKEINPDIDLSKSEPTVVIVIGDVEVNFKCLQMYIGSDQWLSKFSSKRSQICGNSNNRFGAGASACFAAANLFRYVFKEQLYDGCLDNDFIYSTFNGNINEDALQGPAFTKVKLEDSVLIGMGAIGNGFAWALQGLSLEGRLDFVDGQKIDISNLQRYILADQGHVNKSKTDLVKTYLNEPAIKSSDVHFDKFIAKRGNWNIFRAIVCVDSAEIRRLVQGSLPERIINAWTQQEQCGLSCHYDFVNEPCLVCLYVPQAEEKSLPVRIAESFGFKERAHIDLVRQYMAFQSPADALIINLISQIKGIDPALLAPYAGKQLQTFYSEVICGGIMMQLTGDNQKHAAEVPAAFESAMAGIMLAAELVIDCEQLRSKKEFTIQKLNLLRPITKYTHETVKKEDATYCICKDEIYLKQYINKWKSEITMKAVTGPSGYVTALEAKKVSDKTKVEISDSP